MGKQCHVLFVDDDAKLLRGLCRLLPFQTDWQIFFAQSGPEALERLAAEPVDVVISDMRMKHMDGASLLERLRLANPDVVRMMLSGQTSQQKLLECMRHIHCYISKPCDLNELIQSVETIHLMRHTLTDVDWRIRVAGQTALPLLPDVYNELQHMAANGQSDGNRFNQLIEEDMSLLAGLLHGTGAIPGNRTAFKTGLPAWNSPAEQSLLNLILQQPDGAKPCQDNGELTGYLAAVNHRSRRLARLTASLAQADGLPPVQVRMLELSARLHDIGKLILLDHRPDAVHSILRRNASEAITGDLTETQICGVSHCELGAYLLSLRGFPRFTVDSVLWHHTPSVLHDSRMVRYLAMAEALMQQSGDSHEIMDTIGRFVPREDMNRWIEHYHQHPPTEQEQDHALFSYAGR